MRILWILAFLPFAESQSCTSLPDDLDGTWTSTNLGTLTISSTDRTLSMTKTFSSQSVAANYFTCEFNSGTQYVFKTNATVSAFGGNYYIYGCFDFRMSSQYVYYYYLNSDPETGLEGLRLKGFQNAITSISQVCETTLDTAEFNTMVKTGFESQAVAVDNCPTPLLASSVFTYTDNLGTYCDGNNATISACSDPLYNTIYVNSSVCTSTPVIPIFFSTNGSLGCLLSISGSSATYISFYNKDSTILSTTNQFICAAMTQVANNTVYMSIFPTDCLSGQSPTAVPTFTVGSTTTHGAILELVPTGIPPTTQTTTVRSWTWLAVFLPLLAVLIVFIILVICLHKRCKVREKIRAREKPIIVTEEHPLGEMSIALDAPPSLDRVPNGYIDMETEVLKTPRSYRRKGEVMNPIGETSLNLSFAGKNWSKLSSRRSIGDATSDPFTEMDSGVVVTLSPEGSKAPKRLKTPSRQKSFLLNEARTPRPKTNNSTREPLAITDGRETYPVASTPDAWESKTARSERSIKTFLARSVYAPSVMAPSVKAQSVKAPSVKAKSVKAPSVKAFSVKAPSVKARSVKAPSVKGQPGDEKALVVRPKPKITRSYTSTKIGSVTRRAATLSPRKKSLNRSKTMVVQTDETNQNGMTNFMNAEMTNWGDSSEIGRSVISKKSARTARSRAASRNTNISSKTARKSIQPKMTGIPNYFRAVSII